MAMLAIGLISGGTKYCCAIHSGHTQLWSMNKNIPFRPPQVGRSTRRHLTWTICLLARLQVVLFLYQLISDESRASETVTNPTAVPAFVSQIPKWKAATIPLEGLADSLGHEEQDKFRREALSKLEAERQAGKLTDTQYSESLIESFRKGSRDVRPRGSAIFVKHRGVRFLITAKHVIIDENEAARKARQAEDYFAQSQKSEFHVRRRDEELRRAADTRFHTMVRPLRPDELQKLANPAFHPPTLTLSWSSALATNGLDLAIILLDGPQTLSDLHPMNGEFAADLVSSGYAPVSIEDFDSLPPVEGTEIFLIGFPSVSEIAQLRLPPWLSAWASKSIALPNISFGRVSMMDQQLPFFWCDLSAYPGNSGGPVIANGKLAGIAVAQAREASGTLQMPDGRLVALQQGIPFGMVLHARDAVQLVNQVIPSQPSKP